MKRIQKIFPNKQGFQVILLVSLSILAACAPVSKPVPQITAASPDTVQTPAMEPPQLVERYTVVGIPQDSFLSIHQEPSAGSPVLGRIPPQGTDILPAGESSQGEDRMWIAVVYGEITGWVDLDFLAEQRGILPEELITLGQQVLENLRIGEYSPLTALIHPDICLRFSPYPYLGPENQLICPTEMEALTKSEDNIGWGHYDGSGLPINLTFSEYHQKFVYDQDYRKPDVVGFNIEVSSGNAINNIPEIYPDGVMIEYHFPGIDPQYSGLDWRSLRLVFIPVNGHWHLAAIIHCEWTI